MQECSRCNKFNDCQPVTLNAKILNIAGTYSCYLCKTCLFQLQMFVQMWIDESDIESPLYMLYGERTELDE